jgi:adenylate kinase
MNVGEEELIKRLLKRGETSGRSDDTNETVIRERIVEYHKKLLLLPIIIKNLIKLYWWKAREA